MSVEIETNHNSCVSDTVHSISLSGCIAERWKASATKHQNFRKESSRFCNCPWIWFHLALKIESSRFWLSATVHEFDSSICLSACIAISRKLVQECIRRFQAFAPVVYINGRHYLNITTQNAQQKEHLKSQFLKEQSLVSILLLQLSLRLISSTHWCCCKMNDPLEHSLTVLQGGKTDGREESCSCYSRLHARHAVRFRPATGSRIHRVLWVLRQLLPWLQGGQPSVALHNQVRGVLRRQLTRGARRRIRCWRLLQDLPLLHLRRGRHRWWQEALVNTAILLLIIFVFVYEFFVFAFGFARDNWCRCCSSLRWWLHRELEIVQEQAHLTMTGDGSWVASE